MKKRKGVGIILSVLISIALQPGIVAQEPEMFKLVGYAAENGGTTGGTGDTDPITVSNGVDLYEAIKNKTEGPLIIYVNATITPANSGSYSKMDIKDVSDLTIIGVGTSGELDGIGIKITRASNIIIRNLKIHHVLTGDKDCISIEGPADHIWVDHCEIYNEYQEVDKDYYDGLLDAKADCEYLTYSWNYLHDSWKTCLVGSSEDDYVDRKLTMHHNYFRNCNSRIPLFRGGNGHFFNNYYDSILSTAVNSRINACVKIENNYFKNTLNPWVSAYSDILGYGDTIGNITDNCTWAFSDDTHPLPSCTSSIPYEYASVLHNAGIVPALVMAYAGVGKLDTAFLPMYTLTVTSSGPGNVTVSPDQAIYDSGTVVTLSAVPDADCQFIGWGGDTSGSTNPLELKLNENRDITAYFMHNPSNLVIVQAEAACSYNGTINTEHAGFLGTGYIDLENEEGSAIQWSLDALTEITATMTFRYANGNETAKFMQLLVNNVEAIDSVSFDATGAWTSWDSSIAIVSLSAGHSQVKLVSLDAYEGPHFDQLKATTATASIAEGDCEEDTNNPANSIEQVLEMASLLVYPNPITEHSTIEFSVLKIGPVEINLYNMVGRREVLYRNTYMDAGTYTIPMSHNSYRAGLYFIEALVSGSRTTTRIMMK